MRILCFEIKFIGINGWRRIARSGNKIGAIKALKEVRKNLSLREAKDIVDRYMYKKKLISKPIDIWDLERKK